VTILPDSALATELGSPAACVRGYFTSARDGTLLLVVAPHAGTGVVGQICVALELTSLDPPLIRRDAAGKAVVRAIQPAVADAAWQTRRVHLRTGVCNGHHHSGGDGSQPPSCRTARDRPPAVTAPAPALSCFHEMR
jgi:hypothetical protein